MVIRKVEKNEKQIIKAVVDIHLKTFTGFFLTFMGRGFLKQMYVSYCRHNKSSLLVAINNDIVSGFLAYSLDYSAFFKYMIKTRLLQFAWFSFWAFIRKPRTFLRILRAFSKSSEVKRDEKYVELASIGVLPHFKSQGIGTGLINFLKTNTDFKTYDYIKLETDALNNDSVNNFYKKNGFVLFKTYTTKDGRLMNEYRYAA